MKIKIFKGAVSKMWVVGFIDYEENIMNHEENIADFNIIYWFYTWYEAIEHAINLIRRQNENNH